MMNELLHKDIKFFEDTTFNQVVLSPEEESLFITIQTIELAEAKQLFGSLTVSQKVKAMRYIFSHRIFKTNLISTENMEKIKHLYEDSYGSLCDINEKGTKSISLESELITRILYISEAMTSLEYLQMKESLIRLQEGYYVIMQVIKNRLRFHGMKK